MKLLVRLLQPLVWLLWLLALSVLTAAYMLQALPRRWCRRWHRADWYRTPTLDKVYASCLRCGRVITTEEEGR